MALTYGSLGGSAGGGITKDKVWWAHYWALRDCGISDGTSTALADAILADAIVTKTEKKRRKREMGGLEALFSFGSAPPQGVNELLEKIRKLSPRPQDWVGVRRYGMPHPEVRAKGSGPWSAFFGFGGGKDEDNRNVFGDEDEDT